MRPGGEAPKQGLLEAGRDWELKVWWLSSEQSRGVEETSLYRGGGGLQYLDSSGADLDWECWGLIWNWRLWASL